MAGATLSDAKHGALLNLVGETEGHVDDLEMLYVESLTGNTGNINELWYEVFILNGATAGDWNGAAYEFLLTLGVTPGHIDDMWYEWWADLGGIIGPNVNIVLTSGGSCTYEEPGTSDCTAVGTYTANDSGFTNPANTWLWTIEPPVVGVDLTDATLKTCTVTTPTSDTDLTFNLKVVATDSVSTDTANRTTAFTQAHTDITAVPVFIGPDINVTGLVQNAAITPFDVSPRFTGFIESWSLEGAWPAGLVISGAGVLSGTPTDPVANYPNLTFRATNYVGSTDSNLFTVAIIAGEVAPVFSGTVPDFVWELGVPITPISLSTYFTGSAANYTLETGTLPDGITLSLAGALSGTPTTEETQAGLSVTATNGAGADTTNTFQALVWEAIVASTIADQTFQLNELYTYDASVNFTGTIDSWAIGGTWPAGFAIDGAGVITGTATVETTYPNLFVTADNPYEAPVSSATFTGTVVDEILPAFYALTPDETTYEMLGVKIGTGDLTTTHTSDLYAPDNNGRERPYSVNQPVWSNGRIVTNHKPNSQDMTQNISFQSGVTPSAQSAVFTASAGYLQFNIENGGVVVPKLRITAKLSTPDAKPTIVLFFKDDSSSLVVSLTNTPTIYTIDVLSGWDGSPVSCGLDNRAIWGGDESAGTVDCEWMMVEHFDNDDATAMPSEYVRNDSLVTNSLSSSCYASENGNSLLNNVVTEGIGAPLSEVPYLQYYPAAENKKTQSANIASWSKSGSISTALDETGIDGAVTGSTLTRSSGLWTDGVFDAATVLADTNPLVWVFWVKKTTSATTFPACNADTAVKSRYALNTDTGALTLMNGGEAADAVESILVGDYWKVMIQKNNTNLTSQFVTFLPSVNTDAGAVGNDSAFGSCIAGQAELHQNKTIAQVRGLGPIFTTTAAVATDRSDYAFDLSNKNDIKAAYYVETTDSTGAVNQPAIVHMNADNIGIGRTSTGYSVTWWDGAQKESTVVTAPAIDQKMQFGCSGYDDSGQVAANVDGTWSSEGSTFQTYFTGGFGIGGHSGIYTYPVQARNLRRYDITSYQQGKDTIDGLMTP